MAFVPRLSENSPTAMQGNPWWYSSGNVFYANGYGLPNCTTYAYGRFAEVAGRFIPELGGVGIHGDAKDWWNDTTQLTKGRTPQLGACVCWGSSNPSYGGHVAIVEQINSDRSIVTSNSAYGGTYFYTQTIYPDSSGNYNVDYHSGAYYFQGFIYNPNGEGGGGIPIPPGTTWHAYMGRDMGYSDTSQEALDNALLIYQLLYGLGWATESVAAVIGNFHRECGLNPGCWEAGNWPIPTYAEALASTGQPGYGLPQYTPSSVYMRGGQSYSGYNPYCADRVGSPIDGQAQTLFLNDHIYPDWLCDQWHYNYYSSLSDFTDLNAIYPMTVDQFKAGVGYSLDELFTAYLIWYLRPTAENAYRSWNEGYQSVLYWYSIISQYDPNKRKRKKMPVWMMLRYF